MSIQVKSAHECERSDFVYKFNAILKCLVVLLRRLIVVQHKHAGADEDEGDEKVNNAYGTLVGEHKLGEDYAEDGSHETEDSYLRYGVKLEQNAPKRVSDRREEAEVNEDRDTLGSNVIDLTACEKTYDNHHRATEHKLITADNYGVFIHREYFDKNR